MYYRERKFNFWKIIHISLDSLYICYLFWFFAENRCWPVFIYPSSVSNLTLDSRNTVTFMSSEQARLFEYFSTLSSQAGCSFMKALYCISFLCQSPFPVAVLCQTTMTLCFLQVACRQACHEPWGLTVSRRTTSKPLLRLSVFKSFATLPFLDLTFFSPTSCFP